MIVQVALISPKHIIDRSFDYIVPKELEDAVKVGIRVLVPFGLYNNSVEGLIVGISQSSQFTRLKRIKSVVDTKPVCSKELLSLCVWMQNRYLCPFYSAFKLIVPPKMKTVIRRWVSLQNADTAGISEFQKKIVDILTQNDGIMEYDHLGELVSSPAYHRSLNSLADKKVISISEKISDSIRELTIRIVKLKI